MTKRSKITLLSLLALIAAFGLILTGCPDAAGGDSTPPDPKVKLETGSQGTAGNKEITGLTPGAQYLVKTGNQWYAVTDEGKLSDDPITLDSATAAAIDPLDATQGSEVRKITGLVNNTTYSVYLYLGAGSSGNDVPSDLDNGGKNAVVDISTLVSANDTFDVAATAGGANKPTLVFILSSAVTAASAYDEAETLADQSDISDGTVFLSFTTATADGAKVQAKKDDAFITLSNVGATTATTITVTAAATKVRLTKGSPGVADATKITGLTTGVQYLVYNHSDGKWYSSQAGSTLVALTDDVLSGTSVGVAGAAVLGGSYTEITGLTNGVTYTVYQYFGTVADTNIIPDTLALANGRQNAVYNISALGTGTSVSVAAGAGDGNTSIIFLIEDEVSAGEIESASLLTSTSREIASTTTPLYYTISSTVPNGVKVQAKLDDAFITLSNVGANTAFALNISATSGTTYLEAGSPGTPGDEVITGLVQGAKYVVLDPSDGNWRYVTNTGALDVTGNATLTTAYLAGAAALGSGKKITGLTNGSTYTVYAYAALTTGQAVPTNLLGGGKNAIVGISALEDGDAVSVAQNAGDGSSSIIFLIDGVIDSGEITSATELTTTPVEIGTDAPLFYGIAAAIPGGVKALAETGAGLIELSKVGATTTADISVYGKTVLADGSQGTAGNGKITGLTSGASYLVYNATPGNEKWYYADENGELDATGSTTLTVAYAANAEPLNTEVTEITGLTNGNTYDVYLYGELANGKGVGTGTDGNLVNNGKNAVADVSQLTGTDTFKLLAGAGNASIPSTIYFILAGATSAASGGSITYDGVPAQLADSQVITCTTPTYSTNSTVSSGAATVTITVPVGLPYFILSVGTTNTTATFTVG